MGDKPRVLLVSTKYHPFIGGGERQVKKLAGALVRQGVKVKIVTGKLKYVEKNFGPIEAFEIIDGIEDHRHFARGLPLNLSNPLFFLL